MQDFETLNATDFQYGLSARYILPRLNTTLSADGNMYSRRGYGSSELNTDDFVLNASISQPFFKSKLIARIEAFDLLHQLSNTQYTVPLTAALRHGAFSVSLEQESEKEVKQYETTPKHYIIYGAGRPCVGTDASDGTGDRLAEQARE